MKVFILALIFILGLCSNSTAQMVSIFKKDAVLADVMQDITSQAHYRFVFQHGCDRYAKLVTVDINQKPIEEVLKIIFRDQSIICEIDNRKMITLKCDDTSNQNHDNIPLQTALSGAVKGRKGDPVNGATILLKENKSIGTISGKEGEFILNNAPGRGTLIISYLGYKKSEVKYANYHVPPIRLRKSPEKLKETKVRPGSDDSIPKPEPEEHPLTAEELNTGNTGTLSSTDITNQAVNDPLLAMNGRIAGLSVTPTSGLPGAYVKMDFRGQNSMNRRSDLLYVIDGVPFNPASLAQAASAAGDLSPFSVIDIYNIENITVLKDAAATALYGGRGANGVMLITMKKGKAGRIKFDLRLSCGRARVAKRLDLMNKDEYTEMRKEAFQNDGAVPGMFDYDLKWEANKTTDWQKELIGGTALFTDGRFTCYGGDSSNQFLISAGYRNENTVFPGQFVCTTKNINSSFQHQSKNRKFKLSFSGQYNYNNNAIPRTDPTTLIYMAPGSPDIYIGRQLNWANKAYKNPFGSLLQPSNPVTKNLISHLTTSYEPLRNLLILTNLGFNWIRLNDFTKIPSTSVLPTAANLAEERMSTSGRNTILTLIIEPQISYKWSINGHSFDYLIGSTFQQNDQNGFLQTGWGFKNDSVLWNPSAAAKLTRGGSYAQYRYNTLYTKAGYNYQEKYVLDLTRSLDRSSRFGPGKGPGIFWAAAAAWIFSNASFIKKWEQNSLTFGKISASIGRTGNDQILDYQYLNIYNPAPGYFGDSGLLQTQLGNSKYFWEIIKKIDLSVQLEFRNSLGLKLSIFRNRTKNQLFSHNLPATTGFTTVTENLPVIIQNIGMELEAHRRLIKRRNFIWDCTLNMSVPQNKLISCPDISQTIYAYRYAKGYPLTVKYLFHCEGVDPKTGLYLFQDRNKDGARDEKDMSPFFIGQRFFGGFGHTLSYKGLSLDLFFQFVIQKGCSPLSNIAPGQFSELGSNQMNKVLDRWKASGDQVSYQKFFTRDQTASSNYNSYKQSDAQLEDASFVRARNISLSWSIPEKWSAKCKLQSARIFIQGQNVFTLTRYKGLDPESQVYGKLSLPPLRVFSTGLQATL